MGSLGARRGAGRPSLAARARRQRQRAAHLWEQEPWEPLQCRRVVSVGRPH